MGDVAVTTCRRSEIIRCLENRYPQLEKPGTLRAVVDAVRALRAVGLDDDEYADRLVATVAERRIRQQLGIDPEVARLDPQRHAGRSSHVPA